MTDSDRARAKEKFWLEVVSRIDNDVMSAAKRDGEKVSDIQRRVYAFFDRDLPQYVTDAYIDYMTRNGREPKYLLLGVCEHAMMRARGVSLSTICAYKITYEEGKPPRESIMGVDVIKVAKVSFFEFVGG